MGNFCLPLAPPPLPPCWLSGCLWNKHDMWFLLHGGHKNKYFLQLNFNTECFSFPPRNTSCCHKPKSSYDHPVLSWAFPCQYRLPNTHGSKDAEAPAPPPAVPSSCPVSSSEPRCVCSLLRGCCHVLPMLEGQTKHFSAFGDPFLLEFPVKTPASVGLVCENCNNIINASNETYRVLIS